MEIPSLDSSWTLFLDRDGVINRKREMDYVKIVEEFEWLAGAADAIALLNSGFGRTFIVTNQAGIGKGLMSEADVAQVHALLLSDLTRTGGNITAIYHCPHKSDAGCECRKPRTGMPLQAQREFPEVNFSKAVMVGDSASDLEMGRALGMINVLIGPPYSDRTGLYDFQYYSLREFADTWIKNISPANTADMVFSADYWNHRYIEKSSAWDLGKPSAPLMDFMSSWTNKESRILMPGGGGGH
jgi:D-glycero-D-manno-heptose 1,7-bisphosphate phosphatase